MYCQYLIYHLFVHYKKLIKINYKKERALSGDEDKSRGKNNPKNSKEKEPEKPEDELNRLSN